MAKTPEQLVGDLAKSLTHAQLAGLFDLLVLSGNPQTPETPSNTSFLCACELLLTKVDAARECDRLQIEATRALEVSWKQALPLAEQLEELANQHGLGFYLLQADSLRYACGRERAHEARQTKF